MTQIPFEKRQFGEDIAWAKAAILSGATIVQDPQSVVIHSHNNSSFYEFKRVYLDHQNLYRLIGLHTIGRFSDAMLATVKGTGTLARSVWRTDESLLSKIWWTLKTPWYVLGQNMGQYLGARSAIKGTDRGLTGWMDRRLRKGV
jgi:GT2 family glycosyltransferase